MIPFSFGAGILVTLLVPIILLALGAINMGADVTPGLIEKTLAPWALDRSVERRAPKEKNPYAGEPAAIATGLDHYRENCVICHGAPDVAGAELSKGINPPAPSLGEGGSDTPDGELFWVIKHGIRMTAMPAFGPTHSDEEIWKLVAFIHHLPALTAPERESLRKRSPDGAQSTATTAKR
ncbi:MAG: cytochrome c [Vicinamibacteria bacterium]|nr:cytochrome c [Vicinamibacteria bacterium]